METIQSRLKGELDVKGWSTRKLQQEVEQLDATKRGTSYSSVYNYVEGGAEPPLAFIDLAAQVLKVEPAWLAYGVPPKRPAERTGVQSDGRFLVAERDGGPVRKAALLTSAYTWGVGQDLMVDVVHQLVAAQPPETPRLSEDELAAVTRALESNLFGTWNAIARDGFQDAAAARQFFLTALVALRAAVPGSGKGRPVREVLELLPQPRALVSTKDVADLVEFSRRPPRRKRGAAKKKKGGR